MKVWGMYQGQKTESVVESVDREKGAKRPKRIVRRHR
jgi:hypothetical protein